MTEGPVWQRIAQTLSAEIDAQARGPGERLPSEAQLAAQFGVNRHTVRRAIESLARRGLLRVEQGRGAFVAADVLDYTVAARTRFSEWIRRQDKVPAGRVLRLREIAAPALVAAGLEIAAGETVVLLERLGLADGAPISLSDHHFAAARLPGIAAALRDTATITEALDRVGVADYVRRSTRVAARMPSAGEADLLRMPPDRPLLVCENVNVDAAATPIEFGVARYPSTRVQVVFEP